MKRTRAQQPAKATTEPQDPEAANPTTTKPQRRAKQPRQPKQGAKKQLAAAATPTCGGEAGASLPAAANAAASPGPEPAPTVPDVCGGGGYETGAQNMDWDLDAGLSGGGGAAWWTWGVDEDKLLGWFPFVEEDFRCLGGRAGGDGTEVAFDDDIWRIHQIYEIPSYAAK